MLLVLVFVLFVVVFSKQPSIARFALIRSLGQPAQDLVARMSLVFYLSSSLLCLLLVGGDGGGGGSDGGDVFAVVTVVVIIVDCCLVCC